MGIDHVIRTKLVGVTFVNSDGSIRQKLIRRRCRPGTVLRTIREPENPHDSEAIGVWAKGWFRHWGQIGYLSADLAGELATIVDAGGELHCVVLNVTGGWFNSLGVNVEIVVDEREVETKRKPRRR